MAKDDFHVIVYQVLAYLYQCLKNGEDADVAMLANTSPLFASINGRYWHYIVYQMHKMGLIDGVVFSKFDGGRIPYAVQMGETMITPKGIEYLMDNAFIEKAKQFLKDIKEIVPFA